MLEADLALKEFKKICPPHDENNLDREWLEMFGFYWKGWQAKASQQGAPRTSEWVCPKCGTVLKETARRAGIVLPLAINTNR
jgi:RNA polymerase subunit RPABC4/transcription elongation factor Spt4